MRFGRSPSWWGWTPTRSRHTCRRLTKALFGKQPSPHTVNQVIEMIGDSAGERGNLDGALFRASFIHQIDYLQALGCAVTFPRPNSPPGTLLNGYVLTADGAYKALRVMTDEHYFCDHAEGQGPASVHEAEYCPPCPLPSLMAMHRP